MSLNYFISYVLILFLATISPGPNMLLALSHGANYGIVKSIISGFGNLLGNVLMAVISLLGLGIILVKSGIIFDIVRWLGAVYLIFMGIRLIFSSSKNEPSDQITIELTNRKKNYHLFTKGFLVAISNPKGIVFFSALFPQFINTENVSLSIFLIIFLTLIIIAFSCYMLYAIFGKQLSRLFQIKSLKKIINSITGAFFIGIGLTIAFSKNK